MRIIPIDPAADARWLPFLEGAPDATVFYHPAWLNTLAEAYGYARACLAAEENGVVVGVLPLMEINSWITGKRGVCLPFSDACGPLATSAAAGTVLLEALEAERKSRSWKYAEVRGPVAHAHAVQCAAYKYHRIVLSADAEATYARFNKKRTQWSIQKSQASRVVVEQRTDREALDRFIWLNDLTRRKHGIPPQPKSFFHAMHQHVIGKGLGFVNIATVDGAIAAASVWLGFNKILIHKYSASDVRFLKACPNHAIVWDAIQWACANDFTVVDFGRSDLDGEGLIKFKQGWGSEESELHYFRWGEMPPKSAHDSTHRYEIALRHMPLPALRLAGRLMYRHIG